MEKCGSKILVDSEHDFDENHVRNQKIFSLKKDGLLGSCFEPWTPKSMAGMHCHFCQSSENFCGLMKPAYQGLLSEEPVFHTFFQPFAERLAEIPSKEIC